MGNMRFQDVAKKRLQYGDEDVEKEKEEMEKFKTEYKPLVDFFVKTTNEHIKDGKRSLNYLSTTNPV